MRSTARDAIDQTADNSVNFGGASGALLPPFPVSADALGSNYDSLWRRYSLLFGFEFGRN